MKRILWLPALSLALAVSIGCDDVKTVKQTEETHVSEPTMKPPETVPDVQMPPAARWPGAPQGVSAQDALMARRAAELDAYRKLAERIKGLRIDSRTYVRDFVTESDQITADTVAHIRGVTVTRIAFPPGEGICEVEVAAGLSQIYTYVKELQTRHHQGDNVKAVDYQTMRSVNKQQIITASGQGAIRGR